MKLMNGSVANAAAMGRLRRDLHAHPELSFEELRTAARVARKLTEWGVPTHQGMAQTGVMIAGLVGEGNAWAQEPAMASEDFAFMLQAKAGAYCFIGNGEGGHGEGPCMPHNPRCDFNDELFPLGASYWVRLAEAWLGAPRL